MKKSLFLTCAAVAAIVCVAFAAHRAQQSQKMTSPLMRANLEALSRGESGGVLVRNFKSGDVWIVKYITGSVKVSLTDPGFVLGATIERYRCCLNATDMDGCDFAVEEDACARYVVRNEH